MYVSEHKKFSLKWNPICAALYTDRLHTPTLVLIISNKTRIHNKVGGL